MCFTIPGKIEKIDKGVAAVGEDQKIDLGLVTDAKVGDWILHNGDRVVKKISKKDAKTLMKIFKLVSPPKDDLPSGGSWS